MKLMQHVMGCLFVTAMATPAMAEGASLQISGALTCDCDTLTLADGDGILATSASESPMVIFAGQPVRIRFEVADAGVAGASAAEPDSLTLEVDVTRGDRPMETLSVNFTKVEYKTAPLSASSKLDGRYALEIEGGSFVGYRAQFFRAGVSVAAVDIGGAVATFTLDKKGKSARTSGRTATGGEWMEIASTTFDAGGARLADGRHVDFDTMVISGRDAALGTWPAHGHVLTGNATRSATIRSLAMTGVSAMWVSVE